MADDFEYISHARLEYHEGYRHAYLGEVPEPVIYGVQGARSHSIVIPSRPLSMAASPVSAKRSGSNRFTSTTISWCRRRHASRRNARFEFIRKAVRPTRA